MSQCGENLLSSLILNFITKHPVSYTPGSQPFVAMLLFWCQCNMYTFSKFTTFVTNPFMYIVYVVNNRYPLINKKLCITITCLRRPPQVSEMEIGSMVYRSCSQCFCLPFCVRFFTTLFASCQTLHWCSIKE